MSYLAVILGLYWGNGKENGNCYLGCRVSGLGPGFGVWGLRVWGLRVEGLGIKG